MSPHPAHAERLRKQRQRIAVRAWEQRQLDTSKGVWWRLSRLLGYSERGFTIDEATARSLEEAGHAPHPVGLELEPPRRIYVLAAIEAARMTLGATIELRPTAAFLAEERIVLVPFRGDSIPEPPTFSP